MNINPPPRFPRFEEGELFDKEVQGQRASDLEERFARGLDKLQRKYYFQYRIPAFDGAPLDAAGTVLLDFLDFTEIMPVAVWVDGEYSHKSYEQQEKDKKDELRVSQFFSDYGGIIIHRVKYLDLQDQEQADYAAKRIFM